jgi:2'-5' RNA ligase
MRLFIAVDLSDEVRQAMAGEQTRMAEALGGAGALMKWVRPEQAHVTLVFLGDTDEVRVPSIVEAVGRDVDAAPFDMQLGGIGVFPPRGAPRALWVGVSAGAPALIGLQRELARRAANLGLEIEARDFHPHLTLARWRSSRASDRARALAAASAGSLACVRIACATLYQSRGSSSGPTYTPLARANLTRT